MHRGAERADPTRAPRTPTRPAPALVSVVMPVRNAAATLLQQLDALAEQTYDLPWELVVVDNGSRDATASLLDAHADGLPMRRVAAGRRPGISVARNAGIRAARGELLLFCDADDVVDRGWIEAMVAAARTGDVVGGRLATGDVNPPHVRASRPPPQPADALATAHGHLPYATGASLGIWASVAEELGGFDESFQTCGDDVDLCWRAQAAGHRLVHADRAVTQYRYRASLAGMVSQGFRYGFADVMLYRRHRDHIVRTRPRRVARVLRDAWWVLGGAAARRAWCWRASLWLGQVVALVHPRARIQPVAGGRP